MMDKKEIRRRAMALFKKEQGVLPAGYTACDYIRVSATYNTGLIPKENMSAHLKARIPSGSKWNTTGFIECYISSVDNDTWGITSYGDGTSIANGSGLTINNSMYIGGSASEVKAIFGKTNSYLSVGTRFVSGAPSKRPNFNKTIRLRPRGNPVDYWFVEVYEDTSYEKLFMNYVPCVEDATGNAGFWDSVSMSFKHGSGMTAGYDA